MYYESGLLLASWNAWKLEATAHSDNTFNLSRLVNWTSVNSIKLIKWFDTQSILVLLWAQTRNKFTNKFIRVWITSNLDKGSILNFDKSIQSKRKPINIIETNWDISLN